MTFFDEISGWAIMNIQKSLITVLFIAVKHLPDNVMNNNADDNHA